MIIDEFERYLTAQSKSKLTVETYGDILRRFMAWTSRFGITEPSLSHVQKFLSERRKSSSHRLILCVLVAFYTWRGEQYTSLVSDLRKLRARISNAKIRKELSPSDIAVETISRILSSVVYATTFLAVRDQCVLRVCLELGLNSAELTRITLDDLPQLALTPSTQELIHRYLQIRKHTVSVDAPFLFVSSAGKPMTRQGFWKRFQLVCERAGCGVVNPRAIRLWRKKNAAQAYTA